MNRLLAMVDAAFFTLTEKWDAEAELATQRAVALELANEEIRQQRAGIDAQCHGEKLILWTRAQLEDMLAAQAAKPTDTLALLLLHTRVRELAQYLANHWTPPEPK